MLADGRAGAGFADRLNVEAGELRAGQPGLDCPSKSKQAPCRQLVARRAGLANQSGRWRAAVLSTVPTFSDASQVEGRRIEQRGTLPRHDRD